MPYPEDDEQLSDEGATPQEGEPPADDNEPLEGCVPLKGDPSNELPVAQRPEELQKIAASVVKFSDEMAEAERIVALLDDCMRGASEDALKRITAAKDSVSSALEHWESQAEQRLTAAVKAEISRQIPQIRLDVLAGLTLNTQAILRQSWRRADETPRPCQLCDSFDVDNPNVLLSFNNGTTPFALRKDGYLFCDSRTLPHYDDKVIRHMSHGHNEYNHKFGECVWFERQRQVLNTDYSKREPGAYPNTVYKVERWVKNGENVIAAVSYAAACFGKSSNKLGWLLEALSSCPEQAVSYAVPMGDAAVSVSKLHDAIKVKISDATQCLKQYAANLSADRKECDVVATKLATREAAVLQRERQVVAERTDLERQQREVQARSNAMTTEREKSAAANKSQLGLIGKRDAASRAAYDKLVDLAGLLSQTLNDATDADGSARGILAIVTDTLGEIAPGLKAAAKKLADE